MTTNSSSMISSPSKQHPQQEQHHHHRLQPKQRPYHHQMSSSLNEVDTTDCDAIDHETSLVPMMMDDNDIHDTETAMDGNTNGSGRSCSNSKSSRCSSSSNSSSTTMSSSSRTPIRRRRIISTRSTTTNMSPTNHHHHTSTTKTTMATTTKPTIIKKKATIIQQQQPPRSTTRLLFHDIMDHHHDDGGMMVDVESSPLPTGINSNNNWNDQPSDSITSVEDDDIVVAITDQGKACSSNQSNTVMKMNKTTNQRELTTTTTATRKRNAMERKYDTITQSRTTSTSSSTMMDEPIHEYGGTNRNYYNATTIPSSSSTTSNIYASPKISPNSFLTMDGRFVQSKNPFSSPHIMTDTPNTTTMHHQQYHQHPHTHTYGTHQQYHYLNPNKVAPSLPSTLSEEDDSSTATTTTTSPTMTTTMAVTMEEDMVDQSKQNQQQQQPFIVLQHTKIQPKVQTTPVSEATVGLQAFSIHGNTTTTTTNTNNGYNYQQQQQYPFLYPCSPIPEHDNSKILVPSPQKKKLQQRLPKQQQQQPSSPTVIVSHDNHDIPSAGSLHKIRRIHRTDDVITASNHHFLSNLHHHNSQQQQQSGLNTAATTTMTSARRVTNCPTSIDTSSQVISTGIVNDDHDDISPTEVMSFPFATIKASKKKPPFLMVPTTAAIDHHHHQNTSGTIQPPPTPMKQHRSKKQYNNSLFTLHKVHHHPSVKSPMHDNDDDDDDDDDASSFLHASLVVNSGGSHRNHQSSSKPLPRTPLVSRRQNHKSNTLFGDSNYFNNDIQYDTNNFQYSMNDMDSTNTMNDDDDDDNENREFRISSNNNNNTMYDRNFSSHSSYPTLTTNKNKNSLSNSRFHSDFDIIGELGHGSFGSVYKVLSRLDGCMYAIKAAKRQAKGVADRDRMLKEVYALAALSDQADTANFHIVRYHQAWMEDDRLYIQTELCSGTLCDEMNRDILSMSRRYKLLREILLALEFIHRHNMVHLDIKPENIFLKNDQYKLGDFGLVTIVSASQDVEEGDSRYMSMELLSGDKRSDLTKSDIFSLGITMYEICLHRALPMNGQEWQDIRAGKLLPLPNTDRDMTNIIQRMMDPNPMNRPTPSSLLKHPQLLSDEEKALNAERSKVIQANIQLAAQQQRMGGFVPPKRSLQRANTWSGTSLPHL